MIVPLFQALTSRVAGPAASALALVLAVALVASWISGERARSTLETQVVTLRAQLAKAGGPASTGAAACEGGAGVAGAMKARATRTPPAAADSASSEQVAARLTREPPPGLDACARMESADAAVLSTLQ